MSTLQQADILDGGNSLRVSWLDGSSSRFHALWLRDNALNEQTRSASNGQRLITLADIPTDNAIASAEIEGSDLVIQFSPDDTLSRYPSTWLMKYAYDGSAGNRTAWVPDTLELWDEKLHSAAVTAQHKDVVSNTTILESWLAIVKKYGIAKLDNGPIKDQALLEVVKLFGYIRETNYGKWFEVRTEVNPSNLAYTGLGLQAHTDNPYRDPVPTLQILYCLENSAAGGENQVVDGFNAAMRLKELNPDGFQLLSRYCARFEYRGSDDIHLQSRRPMIEQSPDGEIIAVRFNNRSTAPISDVPYDDMSAYYAAYRQFGDIINDISMAMEFKLNPGDCFIVDNTRVLHGRAAYSSTEGSRWLQGCYADKDALLSRLSTLKQSRLASA